MADDFEDDPLVRMLDDDYDDEDEMPPLRWWKVLPWAVLATLALWGVLA